MCQPEFRPLVLPFIKQKYIMSKEKESKEKSDKKAPLKNQKEKHAERAIKRMDKIKVNTSQV